ncbi:MAG: NADH-quinone oxidoreductase subunit M, partial [Chloroflexi bacterium]|nr:NADH-quinone oxidoreductase subunit M [Chloroflexota bacterium]
MQTGYVLLATIALPLFVAILLLAVPSKRADLVRYISIATGFALFGLSAYAFFAYQLATADTYQFELQWTWIENVGFLGDKGITLHLGIDGIGAPMVLLTGIVTFAATLISAKIDYRNKDYFILLFLLVAGVFGVFTSLDLFFWFFFYELAVLPMYLLIG